MTATLDYETFLASKRLSVPSVGFDVDRKSLHPRLFDFQADCILWGLKKGRAAFFLDCGLGKSIIELEIGRHIAEHTGKKVLIVAPLGVVAQTCREGNKFGIPVTPCRTQADVQNGINITNYEMLSHFDLSEFVALLLDESSIIKSFTGSTTQEIIERSVVVPYRFAFTATPAPNDHEELGNHAEFLGIMTRTEMLSMYFVHDGGNTSQWRMKGHAEPEFWRFVASWAVAMRNPAEIGYKAEGYILPPLHWKEHALDVEQPDEETTLFKAEAHTLTEQRQSKRNSMSARVARVAELVTANPDEPWLIWCELNAEGDALEKAIPGSVQVSGSDKQEFKERAMLDFIDGRNKILISKSSIFGFGMNLQHCSHMAFVGVSHSFEQTYQAIRRCWRFGQTRDVYAHLIYAHSEAVIVRNLKRKQADAERMGDAMVKHMRDVLEFCPDSTNRQTTVYEAHVPIQLPRWLGV